MSEVEQFGKGSIWSLIVQMGVPAIISMIVVVIYNMLYLCYR